MELERETLVEIAVSVGAVGLFVAVIIGIGVTYGGEGLIGEEGGLVLVGAIALFIVLMTGIGYWLSGRES
jgi:hypothetical protein